MRRKPEPDDVAADAPGSLPHRGAKIGRFAVTVPVHRGKHTVVVQARGEGSSFVAIKLATTDLGAKLVEHERLMLRALGGEAASAPGFIATGSVDGQPYCVLSWTRGAEARVTAAELRAAGQRPTVLALCRRIALAYAALHAENALHGQIHPRNAVVDGDGTVGLLDFSVAASGPYAPPSVRLEARFNALSAPELGESLLREQKLTLTAAGEQYSVAALLYLLLTGRMYARLRLKPQELARDIEASPPLRFADNGVEPWPELEEVLGRALEKDPALRYASMTALAEALDGVASHAPPAPRRRAPGVPSPLAQMLERFRRDASSERAAVELQAPTCSVNFGAAGIAFAMTRLAKLTGEAADLEQAERWLAIADERRDDANAFDDGKELTQQAVGPVSPFHNASGVAAVRALLGDATGDDTRQQAALDEFRAATSQPCANLDLTLGRSAVLLLASLLYAISDPAWPATQRLGRYGDQLCDEVWRDAAETAIAYWGVAHGWAGIAYATLMWGRARGVQPPPQARAVLDVLAGVAEPLGRGCRWPLTPPEGHAGDQHWPGWCHGNAGYVFVWNLGREVYGDERFGELAARAAWLVDSPAAVSSLCCGSAGQAYAALNQYRSSGEERWRALAVRLAGDSASNGTLAGDATSPLSLYKGHVGLALLAAELQSPERAAMPLFEFEPLSRRQTSDGQRQNLGWVRPMRAATDPAYVLTGASVNREVKATHDR